MLLGHRTGQPAIIAAIARIVVIADFVFTATAVVVQPLTGALLAWNLGFSLGEKAAGDEALKKTDLDWVILRRPS